ncbi:1,4-beta-xylanase [Rathayibacter sp. YIM 133350]|uniref:glycoside hydrolase family 113 n=1 Tax=Rathayibacter sp. YIM 133350 TaxID=3131992 RepID=UPI00307DF47A
MSGIDDVLSSAVCGMTWGWTGIRGTWGTDAARSSMRAMTEYGANWTAIAYAAVQESAQSTAVPYTEAPTVTDDEVVWAIREAKAHGLKVCLKPVVNVADGTWRAYIGFFDWDVPGEPAWGEWFASYTAFIVHAAEIAEREGCEMLCIGCEMVRADGREAQWRALVASVRAVYSGIVTYNCDKYQEDHVTWWDAVDVVSSSGYYPIESWEAQLDRIEAVVQATGKPFVFMEAGCPSRAGSALRPNDWALPGEPSQHEQLDYYEAMFAACERRPWMRGFFLWDWPPALYPAETAAVNDDYCVYGKSAGAFLTERYRSWQSVGEP